jgi:AcrR family transcriptional regulator
LTQEQTGPGVNIDRRQQVLEAARAAIAEHGLSKVRMAHIAELSGMSAGHILYYFKTKDRILVETLRWSESESRQQWQEDLAKIDDAATRLAHFIAFYVPSGPRDPGWALWVEVYGMALASPEIVRGLEELDQAWHDTLEEIVALGIRQGQFRAVDVVEFADRFIALLNGYAMRITVGDPRLDRDGILRRAISVAAGELGVPPSRLRVDGDSST